MQAELIARLVGRSEASQDHLVRWVAFAPTVSVRRLEELVSAAGLCEEPVGPEAVSGDRAEPDPRSAGERQTCAHPTQGEAREARIGLRVSAPSEVIGLFQQTLAYLRLLAIRDRHTSARHRIHERDEWRCTVPGCTSQRNLQRHHIVFRSAGGGHGAGNQTTLCAFHHLRGVHAGRVRITGEAPHGLTFELGVRATRAPLVRYASGDRVMA